MQIKRDKAESLLKWIILIDIYIRCIHICHYVSFWNLKGFLNIQLICMTGKTPEIFINFRLTVRV